MNLLVLIPIAAVFVVAMILGRNELVKRRIACPHKRMDADVEVKQRYRKPTDPVGIERCSLLDDPKHVTCDEACLKA